MHNLLYFLNLTKIIESLCLKLNISISLLNANDPKICNTLCKNHMHLLKNLFEISQMKNPMINKHSIVKMVQLSNVLFN